MVECVIWWRWFTLLNSLSNVFFPLKVDHNIYICVCLFFVRNLLASETHGGIFSMLWLLKQINPNFTHLSTLSGLCYSLLNSSSQMLRYVMKLRLCYVLVGLSTCMYCPCSCYDEGRDTLAFTKVDSFHPDKIYYHGCLKSFLQITKWRGPEVGFTPRWYYSNC